MTPPKTPHSPLPAAAALALLASACTLAPLKGGRATTTGPITQSLAQGQNPSTPSRQDQETIKIRTCTLPDRIDSTRQQLLDTISRQGETFERRIDRLETSLARIDERTKSL
jgi:hypothetical protein